MVQGYENVVKVPASISVIANECTNIRLYNSIL